MPATGSDSEKLNQFLLRRTKGKNEYWDADRGYVLVEAKEF